MSDRMRSAVSEQLLSDVAVFIADNYVAPKDGNIRFSILDEEVLTEIESKLESIDVVSASIHEQETILPEYKRITRFRNSYIYSKSEKENDFSTPESPKDEESPDDGFRPPVSMSAAIMTDTLASLEESFTERLRRYLINKNLNDVTVYKKANLSRQHWSKIISHNDYQPSKRTAVALALALQLNLDETKDLLHAAGFVLSHSYHFDLIIEYCIVEKIYNLFEINEILFKYEQPLLG